MIIQLRSNSGNCLDAMRAHGFKVSILITRSTPAREPTVMYTIPSRLYVCRIPIKQYRYLYTNNFGSIVVQPRPSRFYPRPSARDFGEVLLHLVDSTHQIRHLPEPTRSISNASNDVLIAPGEHNLREAASLRIGPHADQELQSGGVPDL